MKTRLKNPLDSVFLFRKELEKGEKLWKVIVYWLWRLVVLLGGAAMIGYITLKFAYATYPSEVFQGYLYSPELVVWNILPAVWLIFFLYALFGRGWLAFLAGGGSVLALSLGNFFKLLYRDDPLIFEDLLILREAGMMATGEYYDIFIDNRIAMAFACLAAGTVFLALFARGAAKGWKKRIALLLAAVIAGAVVFDICCDKHRYDSVRNYGHLNQWNQTQNYVAHGCLYPFVYSIGETVFSVPDGYSKGKAEDLLAAYEDADIPEEKKVNLITLMREAYVDFSKYDIEGLDVSGYELYHALQAESYTGTLLTNIFAGGTVDSERSFLSGLGDNHSFRMATNSYIWYLRSQGYTVEGSHPYYNWFYNRDDINPYMGYENYRFLEGDYEKLSGAFYVRDSVLFSEIYNDFVKNKDTGKPYFSFSLNMQSHGPYYTDVSISDREYLTGNYSQQCKNAMDNYMFEIMDGDRQLMALVEQLRADEEPVVLVVYSDHLPWMGDGNIFYAEMGVDVDGAQKEDFRTRYETDYLIWANDAAKELLGNDFSGHGPTVSPHYLMNLVFDLCGWEGPAFMQAMGDVMESLPVITSNDFLMADGKLLTQDELTAVQLDTYRDFLYLQHYWRNEFMYRDVK